MGVGLLCVIEGAERRGPDPLDIPEMKIFVRDRRQKLAVARLGYEIDLSDSDVSGVQMLNGIGRLSLNFEQKKIFLVGKLAEDRHRFFDNVLNVGEHLRRAQGNVALAEYEVMPRAGGFEIEDFEVADESRRIDEDVVIGRHVSVASLLESGVDLPAAGHVVLESAGH